MKKILFTATVDSHILNFHIPYIKWFKENGYEVHVASNGTKNIPYVTKKFNIPFERAPFKLANFKAYKELKYIIEDNDYVLIHCHTPVGSAITRLAAKNARKKGTKIIYTAHGFHFFKGAPLQNWLIYYPIEKWLSRYTDCLITINEEDYNYATNKKFRAGEIKYVHGVGVDLSKFYPVNGQVKYELRLKHGFSKDDFILIYPAELNKNKNQYLLIDAVVLLKDKIPNLKLILAGNGELLETYKSIVFEKGLSEIIIFPGFRKDIDEFIKLSDISVASSIREGLGLNVIEGMACGLPVVATDNRGHRELIKNNENGYLINLNNAANFSEAIFELYKNKNKRKFMGEINVKLVNKYSVNQIVKEMCNIYSNYL